MKALEYATGVNSSVQCGPPWYNPPGFLSLCDPGGALKRQYLRKYPRISIAISFSVEYTVDAKTYKEKATTLGGGGLFIATSQEISAGTELRVRFRPEKRLPLMEALARVCYTQPGEGMALEFIEMRAEIREMLLRLIHRKLGDKRMSPRAPLATQIQGPEFSSLALSRDISIGGMFIDNKEPIEVGKQLIARFHLDDNGPIIQARVEVMYTVGKLGMGVQFVDVNAEDHKRIAEYVTRAQQATSAVLPASPTPQT